MESVFSIFVLHTINIPHFMLPLCLSHNMDKKKTGTSEALITVTAVHSVKELQLAVNGTMTSSEDAIQV